MSLSLQCIRDALSFRSSDRETALVAPRCSTYDTHGKCGWCVGVVVKVVHTTHRVGGGSVSLKLFTVRSIRGWGGGMQRDSSEKRIVRASTRGTKRYRRSRSTITAQNKANAIFTYRKMYLARSARHRPVCGVSGSRAAQPMTKSSSASHDFLFSRSKDAK